MLTIRSQQIRACAAAMQQRFVRIAIRHVSECFPEDADELGTKGVEALVLDILNRADRQGFVTGEEILRYLNLAVTLGAGFDSDREFPWAASILKDGSLTPEEKLARMESEADRLCED